MKKVLFPLVLLSLFVLAVCAYAADVRSDLSRSLIRLHIIAESDSDYDQSIKLAVRDEVLKAADGIDASDIDAFISAAHSAANSYLKERGIAYSAHTEYGRFYFPEKQYEGFTLPAGAYYGVRIVLGSGNGHNWWCILYPPLCFDGSNDALKTHLRPDTYDMISTKKSSREIKFRLLELLGI